MAKKKKKEGVLASIKNAITKEKVDLASFPEVKAIDSEVLEEVTMTPEAVTEAPVKKENIVKEPTKKEKKTKGKIVRLQGRDYEVGNISARERKHLLGEFSKRTLKARGITFD